MKYIVTACAALLLAGCDYEVYRYACQNPENWDTAECQKPLCEVSRTCPEHIFKNEINVVRAAAVEAVTKAPPVSSKGECK
jgi:hypothetical protein